MSRDSREPQDNNTFVLVAEEVAGCNNSQRLLLVHSVNAWGGVGGGGEGGLYLIAPGIDIHLLEHYLIYFFRSVL